MPTAYLSLGSNLADRETNLCTAIEHIKKFGTLAAVSSIYETDPVDFTAQPSFLNCALALQTDLDPHQLVRALLDIEKTMGRRRDHSKGPRLIDIDILLFGDSIINGSQLTIPHPAMHLRRFVLEPLCEIAPIAFHPVLKRSARELLEELQDPANVRKLDLNP